MIKNDRQYRLTKAHVRSFAEAISRIGRDVLSADIDSRFPEIQKRALQSQIEEMSHDLQEYEALKSGRITSFEANSLAELPTMLVKARIAQGLTHKDLADSLGNKEQQVQRWEANDYSGASIETLRSVADALGVAITQQLIVPRKELTANTFLASLVNFGIGKDFFLNRVVPSGTASAFRDGLAGLKEVVNSATVIARVFGVQTADLLTGASVKFNLDAVAATKFKLPSRASKVVVDAYTLYAHYISALLVNCVPRHADRSLPENYHDFYSALSAPNKPMTLEIALRFIWSRGVIVLPLREAGGFHGAVWKIQGRFIIVLKQTTDLESRWLYDCLHECGHITNKDVTEDIALIEEQEISQATNVDIEEAANDWAEKVIFDGRSEEVEEACTEACDGHLQKLKSVLPAVAKKYNVSLGSLANHMAYRLADQGENWWGAAKNLQSTGVSPLNVARSIFFENVNLGTLSQFDRELINRALAEQ